MCWSGGLGRIGGVAIDVERKCGVHTMHRGGGGRGREGVSAYIVQAARKEPCLACTS